MNDLDIEFIFLGEKKIKVRREWFTVSQFADFFKLKIDDVFNLSLNGDLKMDAFLNVYYLKA